MADAAKLTDAELLRRLAECPRVGQLFMHYKSGHFYQVLGHAIAEATQSPLVIYQALKSDVVFARPLREWRELVQHEGRAVERFRAVEG